MLSPDGKPAQISIGRVAADGTPAKDLQALAGGFVAAGIDEFDAGEEYQLWWLKPPSEPLILPNTARADDWGRGGRAGSSMKDRNSIEWKHNDHLFTIQALLNHPSLQRPASHSVSAIMEAWGVYNFHYCHAYSQQLQSETLL